MVAELVSQGFHRDHQTQARGRLSIPHPTGASSPGEEGIVLLLRQLAKGMAISQVLRPLTRASSPIATSGNTGHRHQHRTRDLDKGLRATAWDGTSSLPLVAVQATQINMALVAVWPSDTSVASGGITYHRHAHSFWW